MSIKKRKFSTRLSLSLALKSFSDTKFLHKITRRLDTALYGNIWLRGNHITFVCGFTLKTGPAVWLLGTRKKYFYYTSVGHSYIQQGLALQPLFQPHRPTTACMSVWRQKVTTLPRHRNTTTETTENQRKWLRDWIESTWRTELP